jgi:hypothetical protein
VSSKILANSSVISGFNSGPRLTPNSNGQKMLSVDDLHRLLTNGDKLTLHDVKNIMLRVRHGDADLENVKYANSLLQESGDYLPSHLLSALIRADISYEEAMPHIKLNKDFFRRLVGLLPTLVEHFKPSHSENIVGVLSCIDDCHNDYHVSAKSLRKDRLLREAKQSLENAQEAVTKATIALERARGHLDFEYESYSALYFQVPSASSPFRHDLGQLIRELNVCSGVLNVVCINAETDEEHFYLSGNDKRGVLVGYAYMMSVMWNGPKLVTTPGSDFAIFCSLLFEAVTAVADESLAGAINRYARSDKRKRLDADELENEADENNDDNFLAEKRAMKRSAEAIKKCKDLLNTDGLSDIARTLLMMNLNQETKNYEAARDTYGPRQVWLHQLNEEQLEKFRSTDIFYAMNELDRARGDFRRAVRGKGLDL